MILRRVTSLAAGAALVGAGCLAYGTFIEAQAFTLRRFDVPILPQDREPIHVLHISDIHLMPWQRTKMRFLRSLADLHPDLVINTGDNHSSPRSLPLLADCLGPLLAYPGAFVFGSNDYLGPTRKTPWSYLVGGRAVPGKPLDCEGLHRLFTEAGWTDLMEHRHVIEIKGTRLELRGTGDAKIRRDRYDEVSGPVSDDADLGVGVIHAPYQRLLNPLASDGLALVIAGHTHGGQVRVPFSRRAVVANCDVPLDQARGLSTWTHDSRTAWLEVTAGLGTSPYAPFRFACRPEAVLLRLQPLDWRPAQ